MLLFCTKKRSLLLVEGNLFQSNEKLLIKVITSDSFENVNRDHPVCYVCNKGSRSCNCCKQFCFKDQSLSDVQWYLSQFLEELLY